MSSWSLGTLANFARLPIRDVVVRSRMKLGETEKVKTGGDEGVGGVCSMTWWMIGNEMNDSQKKVPTVDLNWDNDIVREMGNLAKDGIG
jgi:hypothetical protein